MRLFIHSLQDIFYKQHTTRFFRDRHWTYREFEELKSPQSTASSSDGKIRLLEIGCGVGNFIWPLLENNPNIFIYGCDLSKRAIDLVRAHEQYSKFHLLNRF
jgi:methyltransferase-like protein 6